MGKRLRDNVNSRYVEAANRLNSKRARRKIVAYVESYDDVYFWRTVLDRFEDDTRFFEVMLPSKGRLKRGKKSVLMNFIEGKVGRDMIACVDADYDYLMQGCTPMSATILNSPYVFHTYVYAIENFQCYAAGLHNVCVMATLNDHAIFVFVDYMERFSTPETTYLYIQGHHIFDSVVVPIMTKVCNKLRLERENEISRTSVHSTQRQNEMSCYENSIEGIASMLKKSVGYMNCPQFRRLQGDVARYLDECDGKPATGPESEA